MQKSGLNASFAFGPSASGAVPPFLGMKPVLQPLVKDVAITGMKEGKWRFWTAGDKKSVWVVAAKSASGREYLKAETDWVQPATLLALPDCPS